MSEPTTAPGGENPDLAWDLDDFECRQTAMDFVLQFESTLCVVSLSVEQLYASYNMYFPQDRARKLVVLPDPTAFHDTFNQIPSDAVTSTGIYVLPGELIGTAGLLLTKLGPDRELSGRKVPFEPGVRAIMNKRPANDPFLPVLAKGDLRSFEQSWPVLHLHRIRLQKLMHLSELDRMSMANTITEKLEVLLDTASRAATFNHSVSERPGVGARVAH